MTQIEYIDDLDDTMEAPYVIVLEEDSKEPSQTQKKKTVDNPITLDSYKAAQRVYNPIQRSTTIKPYKGQLAKPPSEMIFATWNDHVSYAQAWDNKATKPITKREAAISL
jgi:hypothetical protein